MRPVGPVAGLLPGEGVMAKKSAAKKSTVKKVTAAVKSQAMMRRIRVIHCG